MALEKNIVLNTGVTANYHKVTSFAVNRIDNVISINVALYVDETARLNNCNPVEYYQFIFNLENTDIQYTLCNIYSMLKDINFYNNAEDC